MKKSKNIFYFHIGKDEHLLHSIKQTLYTNPESNIYVIGDEITDEIKKITNFYSYKELLCEKSEKFIKNYTHYSTNNITFELICILRWFLFRNLAKKLDLKNIFCLDSDMLLYTNLGDSLNNFDSYRYTLSCGVSAAIICINDINVLDNYCDLIDGFYDIARKDQYYNISKINIKKFDHIRNDIFCVYLNRINNGLSGGICDMTFWSTYRTLDDPTTVGEISAVVCDSTFDHNINSSDFYETENGIKKIIWKEKMPYCKNIFLNKLIKFNSLHFQGNDTKKLMKEYKTYID